MLLVLQRLLLLLLLRMLLLRMRWLRATVRVEAVGSRRPAVARRRLRTALIRSLILVAWP